jgi:hypothetical protein
MKERNRIEMIEWIPSEKTAKKTELNAIRNADKIGLI